MTNLRALKCVPCRGGEPQLTETEIEELMQETPEWKVVERKGEKRLERAFAFPDFKSALAFANRVGAAAEEENHHPLMIVEWGQVQLAWWTHVLAGLHRNDFIMAAKSDALYDP